MGDRTFANKLRNSVLIRPKRTAFYSSKIKEWALKNLSENLSGSLQGDWSCFWKLWGWRNKLCFEEGYSKPPNPPFHPTLRFINEINRGLLSKEKKNAEIKYTEAHIS